MTTRSGYKRRITRSSWRTHSGGVLWRRCSHRLEHSVVALEPARTGAHAERHTCCEHTGANAARKCSVILGRVDFVFVQQEL
jgi:hypothetical protein